MFFNFFFLGKIYEWGAMAFFYLYTKTAARFLKIIIAILFSSLISY